MNQTSKRIQYTLPDGSQAYFSRYNLKAAIHRAIVSYGKKISLQAFLEEMADATGNSFSAIKHWLAGHNAPSDLDKLQAIADFLKVELTDLLETEMENKVMNNTVTPIKAVDFSETKNTIRDIYIRIVDYIELFRNISVNYTSEEPLVEEFPALYTAIMHARLDLPRSVFNELSSFAVNYLQQMYCYIRFLESVADADNFVSKEIHTPEEFFDAYATAYMVPDICPWFEHRYISLDDDSQDFTYFVETIKKQYHWEGHYDLYFIPNEIMIAAAYSRLEEILKDYLVC